MRQYSTPLSLEKPKQKNRRCCSCLFCLSLPLVLLFLISAFVFLIPQVGVNILIMGIDSREQSPLGRSDTIIITTYNSSKPYFGMLSIPRDLWVEIPGYDYNRINTANFFAEADQPGSGPNFTISTIEHNFGIDIDYYVRMDFMGFLNLVDEIGGIDVNLLSPTAGYLKGINHFNGEQALAFVRDRKNSDDFFRMERGQIIIKALINQMIHPTTLLILPNLFRILTNNVETNFPLWRWPQLAITLIRVGENHIDTRTITREMVQPFTTEGGANVLAPNWEEINKLSAEMFGQ